MLAVARRLSESGKVGFVDINDNPMARARMNALMAAVAIERSSGIETIPHVTPRDTTVMGLESVLLGAHAEGVRNVLAVTGDPPTVGDYPGSQGVYEVDSIGLTGLLARLNAGESWSGKTIDAPTSFFVGVAVNPAADDLDLELERFERKVEAGARFAMTQALFELDSLDELLRRLGGASPVPLLVGIWPAAEPPARAAAPQRGARDRRSRPRSGGAARGRAGRAGGRIGAGTGPLRRVPREGGGRVRDPAVQATGSRARPARLESSGARGRSSAG